MLAKKFRLLIQNFLKNKGQIFKSQYFLIKSFFNDFSYNRFGIIISKKVNSKSTGRNKLKRIIFNAVKEFIFAGAGGQKIRPSTGKDFLIIVSPKISSLEKNEIINQVKEIFNKITN